MYVWHTDNMGDVYLFVCPSGRTTTYHGSYHLNDVECSPDMQRKSAHAKRATRRRDQYQASTTMGRYLYQAEPLVLITVPLLITVPSKHYNGTLPIPG